MPKSRDLPELARERQAVIHSLANGINIITANLEALRGLQTDPAAIEIMDEMAIAAERVHRSFEALRKLG